MKRFRNLLLLASFVAFVAAALTSHSVLGGSMVSCGIEGGAADPPTFENCAKAGCHADAPVNSGDGSVSLTGVPDNWTPGATYRVSGILQDPGQRLWGFHVTAIDAGGASAGTMTPADGNMLPCTQNQRNYLSQSGQGRRPGTLDGPVNWDFDWTAPAAGAGMVYFYAQGIACNNDGGEGGDFTYTTATASAQGGAPGTGVTLVLQPDLATVARGADLIVRARIKNHTNAPRTVFLASRVRLPNGNFFPRTGFLQQPIRVDLAPGEQGERTLTHHVPPGAPTVTAQYLGLIGEMPNTLLGRDEFSVSVQ